MPLNQQDKKTIIEKVNKICHSALSVVIVEFKNISVNTITKLRKEALKNDVYIHIIRNTLLKIAFNKTEFECLNTVLKGSILVAFSMKHPGSAMRILQVYEKEFNNLKIVNVAFEGKLLEKQEILQLALMPTHLEAVSRFIFTIQEAAIGKLIRLLHSIRNKKEKNK
ncbi:50S ribosomal protein L10 [Buchnera aphidicola (Thelaxes suberi)]|uniref:50S ribosomal protein L10 n=1 Tax=Buchnera aphidicola TaxID=9 RepID=UPI003464C062